MHGILIYRDNFPSVNYLFQNHCFELKFMGAGASVLIGVAQQSTKVCRATQITDVSSQIIQLFSWAIVKIAL